MIVRFILRLGTSEARRHHYAGAGRGCAHRPHLDTAFPVRSPYDPSGRIQRRTWTLTSGADASGALDRGDLNRIDALGLAVLFAVITVLFIACTNLANLSLAEGTSRAQEIAVRTALGASRGRLVREYLLERGIVTVAGAGLGLILLRQLTRAFSTDLPISQGLVISLHA